MTAEGLEILAGKTLTLPNVAAEGCRDEATDYALYSRLASSSRTKNPKLREALQNLANTEKKHLEFWLKYSSARKEKATRPNKAMISLVMILRLILGTTFAIKFLERNEKSTIRKYKSIAKMIPVEDRPQFDEMIRDEEEHEQTFANQTQGSYVKYISFITLGLADAIVEISGIHAGSLGIYSSTELTGLAGIVAGAAASIAMASAAFAQAKQGFQGSATISALFTGVSYFVNAVILATPYFLTSNMSRAITLSVVLAIIIIAFVSYYNSVISESSFIRDFAELAGIMLGATVALFFFGTFIQQFLHVPVPH